MEKRWWKEAIAYQVYPLSFKDSNGDGIGDLRGIIDKLDYIKDLGVNLLWLSPVYCSPMKDNGYDISDYYNVDPRFGTNEELDELIEKAKERGIKILMDLVINHCSDSHPWFKEALKDPEGKYGKYFIFKKGKDGKEPSNWRSIFGGSAWEKVEGTDYYYLHMFCKGQPDFNWNNKELRFKLYEIMNHWLEKGIGGFRVDAITHIKKDPNYPSVPVDGPDGFGEAAKYALNYTGIGDFLSEMRDETTSKYDAMMVAEAPGVPKEDFGEFVGNNGYFSMMFDFSYLYPSFELKAPWHKIKPFTTDQFKEALFASQEAMQKADAWQAPYLENHDLPRSVSRYIPCEDLNRQSASALATILLLLRGTPFIYQGQEIGMTNCSMKSVKEYDDISTLDYYQRAIADGFSEEESLEVCYDFSRDNSRTPMQWDDSISAGFSDSEKPWLKMNPNYKEINVESQQDDKNSLLSFYKELISFRKGKFKDVFVYGDFETFMTNEKNLFAYKRILDKDVLFVLVNFQNEEKEVVLPSEVKEIVFSNSGRNELSDTIQMKGYEAIVLRGQNQ